MSVRSIDHHRMVELTVLLMRSYPMSHPRLLSIVMVLMTRAAIAAKNKMDKLNYTRGDELQFERADLLVMRRSNIMTDRLAEACRAGRFCNPQPAIPRDIPPDLPPKVEIKVRMAQSGGWLHIPSARGRAYPADVYEIY